MFEFNDIVKMDPFSSLPLELVERILCSSVETSGASNFVQDQDPSSSLTPSRPHSSYFEASVAGFSRFLSPRDLASFAATSRRNRKIVSGSQALWRGVYSRRFPHLLARTDDAPQCWRSAVEKRILCQHACLQHLSSLSALHFHKPDLSDQDLAPLARLADEFGLRQVLDSLRHLLYLQDDLTRRYYGKKAFRHLQFADLASRMKRCLAAATAKEEEEIYEEGMIILAECFQPDRHVKPSVLGDFVDEVEREIRRQLCVTRPQSPALKQPVRKDQRNVIKALISN